MTRFPFLVFAPPVLFLIPVVLVPVVLAPVVGPRGRTLRLVEE